MSHPENNNNASHHHALILDNSVENWSNSLITKELKEAISDIVPIQDTDFDRHDFDPILYINEHFSNEQSLNKLDHVMNKLKFKINKIDEEIIMAIRLQGSVNDKGREDLENSKKSILELLTKIKEIKSKSLKSEEMVTEICKDIKTLDFAKKNLTSAITTLRRLQMMVLGLDQMKEMVEKKEYSRVAGLLEATDQISEAFKAYRDNPKIYILTKDLDSIKSKVKEQIYDEFKNYSSLVSTTDPERWKGGCYVINALGAEMKKDFFMWFCDTQLGTYDANNYDTYPLEQTDQRFGWLAKKLKQFSTDYGNVFPSEWDMEEQIAYKFCTSTKFALANLLKVKKEKNEIDVAVMLKVLKKTLEFESRLYDKFQQLHNLTKPDQNKNEDTPYISSEHKDDNSDSDSEEEEQKDATLSPEESIRKRWQAREEKQKRKEIERNSSANSLQSMGGEHSDQGSNVSSSPSLNSQQAGSQSKPPPPPKTYERFRGIISSCFDQFMEMYIEQEDKLLADSLQTFMAKETWKLEDESSPKKVLTSSADLVFLFIKIMNRCSSLSKNEPYFLLFQLFKKYLNNYAMILTNKVHTDVNRTHDVQEDKTLSLIINTSEYFISTSHEMEGTFKKTIDEQYKELIDLKEITNEFSSIIAKSTKSIVSGVEAKIDPHLLYMTRLDWGSDVYVSDTLPSTAEIIGCINETFTLEAKWLSPAHYRYFCDLFAASFVLRLLQTIYKCTRISETSAQYLLLEVSTMKTTLLDLPNKCKDQRNHNRYTKLVQKEFLKVENLLKVVGCQKEALIDTYKQLFPEPSDSEFKKIMDLKGMKSNDKTVLLDKYIQKADQTLTSIKKFLPIPTIFN
ncbi:Vps53-like domain-containing protein [Tieghemostelium lacteum]|uniref:Vps53-like domain-containing protein n=1 Tax=Tieghemostelium lacteum TaxID=361077 RepID=A0A152A3M3_TIELA|nr:Vps53-like domain-containing protein [Tieghemostelium lacteum]|eukprot:KYR00697.1 Vps53-like domain-containing protein [Tieghemostelium lacteum]